MPKKHRKWKISSRNAKIVGEPLKCLREAEIDYIVRELEKTSWRIDGPKGAALILKINPSALASAGVRRGIQKPRNS